MRRNVKWLLVTLLAVTLCYSVAIAGSKKSVAWLGVFTQTVDADLAEAFDLSTSWGAVVNQVVEDSPADEAGIKEDDVIIALDGDKVRGSEDLTDLVRDHRPGDEVVVTVMRDGKKKDLTVGLEKRKGWGSKEDLLLQYAPKTRSFSFRSFYDSRSYIGVVLAGLSEQLGEYFGVSDGDGALISEVEEDSPAMAAGLKAGDVIVDIGGEAVRDAADVQEIIREKDPGDKVDIGILRDRKKTVIAVEVGEREGFETPWTIVAPDLPDVDVFVPKMKGLYKGKVSDFDWHFDAEEFEEEMEQLRDELKKLKQELRDLKRSLD